MIIKHKLIDEIMDYANKLPNKHLVAIANICFKYDDRVNHWVTATIQKNNIVKE